MSPVRSMLEGKERRLTAKSISRVEVRSSTSEEADRLRRRCEESDGLLQKALAKEKQYLTEIAQMQRQLFELQHDLKLSQSRGGGVNPSQSPSKPAAPQSLA